MKLGHILSHASGPSYRDCHFLGLRFDARRGFKRDVGESWVIQHEGGSLHAVLGMQAWFTGLWRSPAGHVYVSDSAGQVHVNDHPGRASASWRKDPLPGVLTGIWGLDDRCVFTWGVHGDDTVLYRWDGTAWSRMDSPGRVIGMHGISPDLVYAVGNDGLIARLDGDRWLPQPAPLRAVLSDVFVASPDEMYAVGAGGWMLEGSVHGWSVLLEGPGPMFGVARLGDEVLVGAASEGLMRLDGNRLVPVEKMLKAERIDARSALLVSSPEFIGERRPDGKWEGLPASQFADLVRNQRPLWLPLANASRR